jgi:hypothetical protein
VGVAAAAAVVAAQRGARPPPAPPSDAPPVRPSWVPRWAAPAPLPLAEPAAEAERGFPVRVINARGLPVANARVEAVRAGAVLARGVTGDDGVVRLDVDETDETLGPTFAIARHSFEGEGAVALGGVPPPCPEPCTSEPERVVEIGPPGIVRGRVVDDQGRAVAGARLAPALWVGGPPDVVPGDDVTDIDVDVDGAGADAGATAQPEAAVEAALLAGDAPADLRTAADGSFRIALRIPGVYVLHVAADGLLQAHEGPLQVLAGSARDLPIRLTRAKPISGVVVDDSGAPVRSAHVTLAAVPGGDAVSDDAGRFRLAPPASHSFRLYVTADGFVATELAGTAGRADDLRITLARAARIRVSVQATGDAVAAARHAGQARPRQVRSGTVAASDTWAPAAAQPPQSSVFFHVVVARAPTGGGSPIDGAVQGGVLDDGGRGEVLVSGLAEGSYRVEVDLGETRGIVDGVRVRAGETADVRVPVAAEPTGELHGTIVVAGGGRPETAAVCATRGRGTPRCLDAVVGGTFKLTSLPAGDYELIASGVLSAAGAAAEQAFLQDRGTSTVTVVAGRTANVIMTLGDEPAAEPDPPTRWAPLLSVAARGGAFMVVTAPAGSGVYGGDELLAIDGTPVSPQTDQSSVVDMLAGARGSVCRLTLRRPASGETLAATLTRASSDPVDVVYGLDD